MAKESIVGLTVFSAVFLLVWRALAPKKKRRKVTFKPVTAGAKFHNKPPRDGEHFEVVADRLREGIPQDMDIRFEGIPGIRNEAAFFVRNVLSREECKHVIEAAERTGFEERHFQGDGTDSSSCVTWSPGVSAEIYKRMKKFVYSRSYFDSGPGVALDEVDFDNQEISHHGQAECINPNIRVEKYNPSQHLKIHRDGCVLVPGLAENEHVYTVYAVLIYLNDEFSGGPTRFVQRKTGNRKLFDFIDVKGRVGDALVFRHEILHSGGVVEEGRKEVLRMDIAYRME